MFLRRYARRKDGKVHSYWALVESYRTGKGSRQRIVAYLGELQPGEETGWAKLGRNLDGKAPPSPTQFAERKCFGDVPAFVEEHLQSGSTTLYADYQRLTDKYLLKQVLRHAEGNLSQAARILSITRATLRTKLNAIGIPIERGGVLPEKRGP